MDAGKEIQRLQTAQTETQVIAAEACTPTEMFAH